MYCWYCYGCQRTSFYASGAIVWPRNGGHVTVARHFWHKGKGGWGRYSGGTVVLGDGAHRDSATYWPSSRPFSTHFRFNFLIFKNAFLGNIYPAIRVSILSFSSVSNSGQKRPSNGHILEVSNNSKCMYLFRMICSMRWTRHKLDEIVFSCHNHTISLLVVHASYT